jgi:hypothetical protein
MPPKKVSIPQKRKTAEGRPLPVIRPQRTVPIPVLLPNRTAAPLSNILPAAEPVASSHPSSELDQQRPDHLSHRPRNWPLSRASPTSEPVTASVIMSNRPGNQLRRRRLIQSEDEDEEELTSFRTDSDFDDHPRSPPTLRSENTDSSVQSFTSQSSLDSYASLSSAVEAVLPDQTSPPEAPGMQPYPFFACSSPFFFFALLC